MIVGLVLGALAGGALVGLWALRRGRATGAALAAARQEVAAAGVRAVEAQRSRDRAVGAIEAFTDGVVLVDETGQVVLRNDAAAAYHDARRSEAVAEAAIEEELARARTGEPASRELQLFGPPRRVLAITALPLYLGGDLIGAVAVVRDVSESRRVENVRRDFVANVTHELKTPIGALELLAETIAAADDQQVVASLSNRLVGEAERLAQIVDDLLDLSVAEANETVHRELVPLSSIVTEALDRVASAAAVRSIRLDVAGSDDDQLIECDRRQVLSAVSNLVDNAIKYSEPGGSVEVSVVRDADRVGVRIADRGIGIPTRDLERIFERFYRVDRARSRDTGGTGLGLSIVRHVVQAHGGDVQVASHEGEGSTFWLWFPAVTATAAASDLSEAS